MKSRRLSSLIPQAVAFDRVTRSCGMDADLFKWFLGEGKTY